MTLRAPFPWYGGKFKAAARIWSALGDVPTYVEPFFGSGAALLARPHPPRLETVNDINAFVANFWRSVAKDADTVAAYADHPINETDLHARHAWLMRRGPSLARELEADVDAYDAKVAGWWVWGLSQWVGGGWCAERISRRSPATFAHFQGRGVHASGFEWDTFRRLAHRLRSVRVKNVDWLKCVSTGTIYGDLQTDNVTGIFFDPPYAHDGRSDECYGDLDDGDVAAAVRSWCVEHTDDPRLRIVLAGYDGEHDVLLSGGWTVESWSASGFRLSDTSRANAKRERLWFSPGCLKLPQQQGLPFGA